MGLLSFITDWFTPTDPIEILGMECVRYGCELYNAPKGFESKYWVLYCSFNTYACVIARDSLHLKHLETLGSVISSGKTEFVHSLFRNIFGAKADTTIKPVNAPYVNLPELGLSFTFIPVEKAKALHAA